MISNGYYPKKLIYLGDNTENRKAILVSAPNDQPTVDERKSK